MDRREYLQKLDSLNLDKNRYRIISGGVMLLHNLKATTSDIDLKVQPDYFEELKEKYAFKKSTKYPNLYELDDVTELKVEDFDTADTKIIGGYPTESLELTLQWMLEHNRPKDQEKIKILQQYLNN